MLPVYFDHADSNAAAGGNGTFEHPFNNLADLQTGSNPGDILYVHANSVFDGAINPLNQGFTLQDNQRFLGENGGLPHSVNYAVRPGRDAGLNVGGATPIIDNSNGNSITLANNNEVSGFNITPSGANSTTHTASTAMGSRTSTSTATPSACPISAKSSAEGLRPLTPSPDERRVVHLPSGHARDRPDYHEHPPRGVLLLSPTDDDAVHIENHGTTALNVTISGNTIVGGAPTVAEDSTTASSSARRTPPT